jgi:hypothetical protein
MQEHTVAVYGASGHTGRFVVAELERRGLSARRISRRFPRCDGADAASPLERWTEASCDDPDSLDRALEGAAAVINCAGPFADTAPAVIESALRLGAHYLDICAEQRAVRQSLATYASEAAARGIVVLPAMAFYGGLADLLAAHACKGLRSVDEVLVGVALSHWHPTAGTRNTGQRNTARRVVVAGGQLVPMAAMQPARSWRFPPPFGELPVKCVPLSEIITISRHIPAARIESYMNEAPLRDLGNPEAPPPVSCGESGKSEQAFVMDVFVTGDGQARRASAHGRDIYAVSAPLVVEACTRLLHAGTPGGGTCAPAELFDATQFLSALGPDIRIEDSDTSPPMDVHHAPFLDH